MRTLKSALRLVPVAGALTAASLALSACDASPYAAAVNGHTITVTTFNRQLSEWAANKAWVEQFDAQNATSQGGNGTTVAGAGGPGTYSSTFATDILQDMVDTMAIEQHLSVAGIDVTEDQTVAARAVNEYLRGDSWTQFSQQLRSYLVQQLASEGALAPVPTDVSSLQQPYGDIQPYLFYTLCVNQEPAFDAAAAQAVISSGTVRGAEICYDQQSLEGQSSAYQAAVRKLAKPGDISTAIPTSFGFVVVKLTSRTSPGLSAGVKQVISAATNPPTAATGILDAAKVTVNPRYGTWSKGQIAPPKAPLSS